MDPFIDFLLSMLKPSLIPGIASLIYANWTGKLIDKKQYGKAATMALVTIILGMIMLVYEIS